MTDRPRKPVLALNPVASNRNGFVSLFSDHLSRDAFDIVDFDWSVLGQGRYNVVVFHWPMEFLGSLSRRYALKLMARMAIDKYRHRTRFVWLVHNFRPHDTGSARQALALRLFVRLLDGLIFLSAHSRDEFLADRPSAARLKRLATVHGRYLPVAFAARAFDPATFAGRLLFFGIIRDYKNVVRLVEAARRVERHPFVLTVAGACDSPMLREEIEAAADGDPRIHLDIRDEHIPDDELERLIDAHDAVVLPYKRILNSGVALHALSRNKPILAPAIGSLPELQADLGARWVHLFRGDFDEMALNRFLDGLRSLEDPAPDLARYDWNRIGRETGEFLAAV